MPNKKTLPFGLYIVNAVQEEIGLRGAKMIAESIKPDIAIITDVSHDTTTPMINKNVEGECKCGDGPIVIYAPAVHNKLKHRDSSKFYKILYDHKEDILDTIDRGARFDELNNNYFTGLFFLEDQTLSQTKIMKIKIIPYCRLCGLLNQSFCEQPFRLKNRSITKGSPATSYNDFR